MFRHVSKGTGSMTGWWTGHIVSTLWKQQGNKWELEARLLNLKACPPWLTSASKAPLTRGFSAFSNSSTSSGPSAQTREPMGTFKPQHGLSRLTQDVFTPCANGFWDESPVFTLFFFQWASPLLQSPPETALVYQDMSPAPVHSETSIMGYQPRPMDMFSKWGLWLCLEGLWSLLGVWDVSM